MNLRKLISSLVVLSSWVLIPNSAYTQICPSPTNVSASATNICLGSSLNLAATIPAGTTTINWYTVATGGTPIATTTSSSISYTPLVPGTYTYYAEATAGGSGPGSQIFNYTGAVQTVTLQPGTYTIECWGGDGYTQVAGYNGRGGYASGNLTLTSAQTMYIYVGGVGAYPTSVSANTWTFNGGGIGYPANNASYGNGGGATDIRTTGGAWDDVLSLATRIIVAGGGGAGRNASYIGGNGGGATGGTGSYFAPDQVGGPTGGSQTAGGTNTPWTGLTTATLGKAMTWDGSTLSASFYAGGGGGYYGGGSGRVAGGGGSSYIGGVTSGTTIIYGQTGFVANPVVNGNGYVKITSQASCTPGPRVATVPVTVNPVLVPSVSISTTNNNLCVSSSLTFTATPTNGGSSPTYQWRVNGINVGSGGSSYTSATLNVNDIVTVVMTSNAVCSSPATATSNSITVVVTPNLNPAVSISNNVTNNTICQGQNVVFTATPTNGGSSPNYQWKVNGSNVGTNANTYSTTTLNNGDVVSCVLTSNAACLITTTANSNNVTMVVNPILSPSVSIASNNLNLCINPSLTFTATPTNGGSTPTYQWRVNGIAVPGAISSTFTSAILNVGDLVTVVLSSSATCVSTSTATSNVLSPVFANSIVPSISISSNNATNTICDSESISFTALPVNGGTNPAYQWKVNGNNVGTNSATYTTTSLSNNDVVSCVLTSNANCLTMPTASSNAITVTVHPLLTSSISITASENNICGGTNVIFTAATANPGPNPNYQWKVNGVNVGTNASTYSSATLNNGDVVSCQMTINNLCVVSNVVMSNSVTMQVVTNVTPTITLTSNRGANICSYDSVVISTTISNGGTSPTYVWKLNGIALSQTTNSISLGNLSNGDTLIAELTSDIRCVTSRTVESTPLVFNVSTSGPISLTPDAINEICNLGNINLQVVNGNGNISWYLNDTLMLGQSGQSIPANREGVYYAVNELNGCYSTSNTSTIILNPMPGPILVLNNQGSYEIDSIYDTYTWYFNNVRIQNSSSYIHRPHAYGNFKVCVTKDDCFSCSDNVLYPDPLSITNNSNKEIKVYPNPATHILQIEHSSPVTLEIRTIDGRLLKTEQKTLKIDVSTLTDGVYMLYIIDANKNLLQVKKFLKALK